MIRWGRCGLFCILFLGLLVPASVRGEPAQSSPTPVTIVGRQLLVNGAPFVMRGVGYAPTPIGNDPSWAPNGDYFTSGYRTIYEADLAMLRRMGANTARLWGWKVDADHTGFLDEAYNGGAAPIYVIATYWIEPGQDLTNATVRSTIKAQFVDMVALHKDHPAILMWAIGNELNAPWMYGDSDALFSLIEEMAQAAHAEEGATYHPVTTPLADTNLIGTITNRDDDVPSLDVWSVQVYRGNSFGTLFDDYAAVSSKPLAITEYGIDAYDDDAHDEYEAAGTAYQAQYAASLWGEIAARGDVCVGGSIMAFSDEWWKGRNGQTDATHTGCPEYGASSHSACGYAAAGHPDGYANEEWWGIVRRVDNGSANDTLQPRAAYWMLRSMWLPHRLFLPLALSE